MRRRRTVRAAWVAVVVVLLSAGTTAVVVPAHADDGYWADWTLDRSFEIAWDGVPGSGYCLDADTNTLGHNGTVVQLWQCNGEPQQQWRMTNLGWNAVEIRNVASGRCLDADANTLPAYGTRVQLWDCNQSLQQRWFGFWEAAVPGVSSNGAPDLGYGPGLLAVEWSPEGPQNGLRIEIHQELIDVERRYWTGLGPLSRRWADEPIDV